MPDRHAPITGAATSSVPAVSHWYEQLYAQSPERFAARPQLTADREADVCIVGAGFTGLWTAYELKRAEPSLEVVVLEARFAGYGASGRNGGAVIAQMNGSRAYWDARGGAGAAVRMERAIQATVDEVGAAMQREGMGTFVKGGVITAARNSLEAGWLRGSVDDDRAVGFDAEDSVWLSPEEARQRIRVDGLLGARFSPHSASIQPGELVRGLVEAAERLGVTIYEHSPVTAIGPHLAKTAHGEVRARTIVRGRSFRDCRR